MNFFDVLEAEFLVIRHVNCCSTFQVRRCALSIRLLEVNNKYRDSTSKKRNILPLPSRARSISQRTPSHAQKVWCLCSQGSSSYRPALPAPSVWYNGVEGGIPSRNGPFPHGKARRRDATYRCGGWSTNHLCPSQEGACGTSVRCWVITVR